MHINSIEVRQALISVSDKTGLIEFARELVNLEIQIISTGGTSEYLRAANIPVKDVSEVTQFPEIMGGRVKTLHPKIHGGILGMRDVHAEVAEQHDITWIDLVVVNLYPFAKVIAKEHDVTEAIENIDIGGPTLIRAAAKNLAWVGVVTDPGDYASVISELKQHHKLTFETRQQLACKAFSYTGNYDAVIYDYLSKGGSQSPAINLRLKKVSDLRYGENPHQTASVYQFFESKVGIFSAKRHQGKELSYNNIVDIEAAMACVQEFPYPACVIVKHANPCGVAIAGDITEAFRQAFDADASSAFGGVIALNRTCDKSTADKILQNFAEVVVAPGFSDDALAAFSLKPNIRILEITEYDISKKEYKFIQGGLLIQDRDLFVMSEKDLQVVTEVTPTQAQLQAMFFAWRVVKHIKSNAILIAESNRTLGIGAGQVSRIDAVNIALEKFAAHQVKNISDVVLASDAFFPFRDSIDSIAAKHIRAVIQPGGSVKDAEAIQACNEHGIAMVFTGKRCFKH